MAYTVKEIFLTLQGEGLQTGCAAVFLRFSGCNLWNGAEQSRQTAQCSFCDTDFIGGDKYDGANALADSVAALWPHGQGQRLVVITGGEPALQVDEALIAALHDRGFRIAIESNGTLALPPGLDWIAVSPKGTAPLAVTSGDELKLVYPQAEALPERFEHLAFQHFLLQPMDGPDISSNTQAAARYCLDHPRWRLSLQTHKVIGLP